jgi:hypothetical protein
MADDNQRYRSSDSYGRTGAPQPPPAGDPLAELARLIGRSDNELPTEPQAAAPRPTFARPQSRAPMPAARPGAYTPPTDPHAGAGDARYADPRYADAHYPDPRRAAPYAPPATDPRYAAQFPAAPARQADGYPRDPRGVPGYAPHGQPYGAPQGYAPHQNFAGEAPASEPGGYAEGYYGEDSHYGSDQRYPDHGDEDIYENAGPARRRGGILTVIAVLLLAVVGTAAAFAYRTLVAGSGGTAAGSPPVIKADTTPNKIVPATSGNEGGGQGKLIYDRVGDRSQTERVVAREEQPVDVKDLARNAPRVVLPGPAGVPNGNSGGVQASNTSSPLSATAGGASEPKKIRTVTIRADQNGVPEVVNSRPPAPQLAAAQQEVAPPPSGSPAVPTPRLAATRPSLSVPAPSQSAGTNGPLSLSPATVASTGNVARPPMPARSVDSAAAEGGPYVQVSSQRSESDAHASFRALQAKFPSLLGDRQVVIRRADLGAKGVYFRAQVGPFASAEQATEFCGQLKAAGGQCVVQRN